MPPENEITESEITVPVTNPTIGRVVLVQIPGRMPRAGLVTCVFEQAGPAMINFGGFEESGAPFAATSVRHASVAESAETSWDWPPRA